MKSVRDIKERVRNYKSSLKRIKSQEGKQKILYAIGELNWVLGDSEQ